MLAVDDLLGLRSVSGAAVSPDGERVAFVVSAALTGPYAEPAGSRIWVVSARGGDARQLTSGPHRDTAPAWSPDGRSLAFLSDRAEQGINQLYVLSLRGGEARPLPAPPTKSISSFAWSPDGQRLGFLARERVTSAVPEGGPNRAPIVVDGERHPEQLFTVELDGAPAELAYAGPEAIWEFAWSPAGNGIALVTSDEQSPASWYFNRVAWLELASGTLSVLHVPPPGRQVARPRPAPDGRAVAFVSCSWSDPGMSGGDLWVVPSGGGAAENLTPGAPYSVNSAAWLDARELLVEAYDEGGTRVGRVTTAGEAPRTIDRGDYTVGFSALSTARDGAFARVRETAREPGDVWLARPVADGLDWRRLTDLHGSAAPFPPAARTIRWKSSDGLDVAGLLSLPTAGTAPYPFVVMVHGGPTGMASHRLHARGLGAVAPLLLARGVAVLWPDYRGSNGRGVAYAEANHGDLGGGDWRDIEAGVDDLVARGIADGDRLGIAGWSYGGFMTMWAVTQTSRFKAAIAGAGIANWFSMHGTTSLHSWERIFLGPDPYDTNGIYATRSPLFQAGKVTTPLLLLHGDADRDVPPGQSDEFYRALRDHGREVEFTRYPGAPHGPHEPAQLRDIMERSLAWFTRHLALDAAL